MAPLPDGSRCTSPGAHQHHAVYEQHAFFLRPGFRINDPLNLLPLCLFHHFSHHGRSGTLPASALPDATREWMLDALGDYGPGYMARYYG